MSEFKISNLNDTHTQHTAHIHGTRASYIACVTCWMYISTTHMCSQLSLLFTKSKTDVDWQHQQNVAENIHPSKPNQICAGKFSRQIFSHSYDSQQPESSYPAFCAVERGAVVTTDNVTVSRLHSLSPKWNQFCSGWEVLSFQSPCIVVDKLSNACRHNAATATECGHRWAGFKRNNHELFGILPPQSDRSSAFVYSVVRRPATYEWPNY